MWIGMTLSHSLGPAPPTHMLMVGGGRKGLGRLKLGTTGSKSETEPTEPNLGLSSRFGKLLN